MTLRMRLALCYGGLTGIVVVLTCGYSFAVHSRTHYDQLDQTLRSIAEHISGELGRSESPAQQDDVLVAANHLGVSARVFRRTDRVAASPPRAVTPGAPAAPQIDPWRLLAQPSVPAYSRIAALAPAEQASVSSPATFAVVVVPPVQGRYRALGDRPARWRVLVLPPRDKVPGLELMTSLALRDDSVRAFGHMMVATAIVSTFANFLLGWGIAGRALRPVATLTRAAADIADSRAFDRRVPFGPVRSGSPRIAGAARPRGDAATRGRRDASGAGDELERLAETINRMLASLQAAYAGQERFVADASHELRAPLSAVAGNLELLGRQLDDNERAIAVLEAQRGTQRLGKLIADLLSLARADSMAPLIAERLALDGIVAAAQRDAWALAGGRHLESVLRPGVVIMGNREELVQLALILLDNAVKFSPAGTPVSLRVERRADRAVLSVRDFGPGVPPAALPHVFDRFFRADAARTRTGAGAGLGLSIAKRIAVRHGASIILENAAGGGALATVSFPLASDNP
jgi:signal transduction histidine kinase